MRTPKIAFPTLATIATIAATQGFAQTELTTQSAARPFGLDIVGPVYQAGSDTASADFQDNTLPELQSFINTALGERQTLDDVSGMALDPTKLSLHTDAQVRVYFVGEGAGYHNTLGFNTQGTGIESGNPQLIFPDSSSYDSYYQNGDKTLGYRSNNVPLLPGDFVDLGSFDSGTQLDFFLIANGAYGGKNIYTADDNYNADGIQHVVSFALPGSPYLLIGFEDLYGGGDRDFNDLLFAVDIGESNVSHLANPEPSTFAILVALIGIIAWTKRNNKREIG